MGNTQGPLKRDRADSGGVNSSHSGSGHHRKGSAFPDDDQCPVQMKIAKGSPSASTPSMQFDNASEYPVVVKWSGHGKAVSIAGSWDGWKRKIPLVRSHDDFTTIINLPEGKHEFKFYVDSSWICDNTLPKTDNPLGSENNVLMIDRRDFEVFYALDRDMQATSGIALQQQAADGQQGGGAGGTGGTGGGHHYATAGHGGDAADKLLLLAHQASFGQDIPDRRDFEQAQRPPVLPPHLLQVILNKDTPISCDPNVLPEPNHVMLNHLYALSIKDGVMVLSGTHRYRKKYVTTLLYKPI